MLKLNTQKKAVQMHIENHQFKATIRALTESDLDELITILGIPRNLWHEKTNY